MNEGTPRIFRGVSLLLEAAQPPRCWLCRADVDRSPGPLCRDCAATLSPIPDPICLVCGRTSAARRCGFCLDHPPAFSQARSVGAYAGILRECVLALKFRGIHPLALSLGRLMARRAAAEEAYSSLDLIVPVPVHRRRLRQRSFNQSQLLARRLGAALGLPVQGRALRKIRPTRPQVGLSRAERIRNVRGAFASEPRFVDGARVLLVDDVLTSGATAHECARALRRAGAAEVLVLTAARAL